MTNGRTRCPACGAIYTLPTFRALPLCTVETFGDGADRMRLEFRHCGCSSTITIEIDANGAPIENDPAAA